MLTVKQVFELARDGLLWQQNLCIKCGDFSGAKKAIQTTAEIQYVIEDLDKKENHIASSNSATEIAVLFALNLKEGQMCKLNSVRMQRAQQSQEFASQYEVRIIHLTNKVQVLKFDILKAAEATFELLKYELEVKRIRGASVVKTIPEVGFRQELYQIGSRYTAGRSVS